MYLKYIGSDGNKYGLKPNLVYNCALYTDNGYIWVRARNFESWLFRRHISVPYSSIAELLKEWEE